jgi:hypothetical protein
MNHRVMASLLENEKAEISERREIHYSKICEDGRPCKSATYLGWQHRYSTGKIVLIYTLFYLGHPYIMLVFAFHAMVLYTFYPFCVGHAAEKFPICLHQPAQMETSPPTCPLY